MSEAAVERPRSQQEFNSADFRGAVGAFATGVTVITTHGEADRYGMTANAFSSVSLDPPLVLVCVISGSTGAETIQQNGAFAVNVLGAHQEAISRYFASRDRPGGQHAFRDIPHFTAVTGSPILERAAAYLDCRLAAAHEAGDHLIFIGEVVALGVDKETSPLLFHHGGYSLVHAVE
jgi:flavin reductase (DIM6/NTAB) family NADH-FMN oxidoreductase RutF